MNPAVRLTIRADCWVPLLLALYAGGCSGAPTRPESVGRGDYAKVVEYASALDPCGPHARADGGFLFVDYSIPHRDPLETCGREP